MGGSSHFIWAHVPSKGDREYSSNSLPPPDDEKYEEEPERGVSVPSGPVDRPVLTTILNQAETLPLASKEVVKPIKALPKLGNIRSYTCRSEEDTTTDGETG